MTELTAGCCRLYLCPVPDTAGSRRDCEKAAVESLIAQALGEGMELTHSPEGAPSVSGHPELRISISHSASHCLLAVGNSPHINIGVDIESPRPQLLRVAQRFLTPAEEDSANLCCDEPSRLGILLKYWTAKEAAYKAALTPGLALQEIHIAPDFTSAQARGSKFSLFWHSLPACETIALACLEP